MHLYSYRGQRAFGVALFDLMVTIFPVPFPIRRDEILDARRLVEDYPTLSPRDAIHAAVALRHDLEGIVSADRGFDEVMGLRRYDPMELDGSR